jgi:UDP-glucose 4-epimerase
MRKKILITGGSGFLGRRLGKKLSGEYEVTLASRNNKQNFIAQKFSNCQSIPMDVSHIESVRDVFNEVKPDIAIHAAATKFVDLAEKYPMECIDVNVIGSQNVARVGIEKNVETIIGISTDKASPPIKNIYGLSKAMMEKMFCSLDSKSETSFACVRYGNVAWSTGSVLPLWKTMFEENRKIFTTGPQMRRFFFTVDEAVDLVITAVNNINTVHGKVLSKEMKSAKIEDILNIWTEKYGGTWEKVALRPGDRIDEYLIGELELPYAEKVTLNGGIYFLISFNLESKSPLVEIVSSANAPRLTKEEIINLISNPPEEEL